MTDGAPLRHVTRRGRRVRQAVRLRGGRALAGAVFWLLCATGIGSAQPSPLDGSGLGDGPYSRMHMLLEKTIFKVDVLTLEVRLTAESAKRVQQLVEGSRFTKQLADSVAAVVLDSRSVWARIEFERDVSLEQFLDGIRDNLERAVDAGIVDPADYESIVADLPVWYAFLAERRIRSGDEIFYRITGDTLRTAYRGADGEILLDQTDVGPERRLSVLGGYFAPKSDFRDKLVKSLVDPGK